LNLPAYSARLPHSMFDTPIASQLSPGRICKRRVFRSKASMRGTSRPILRCQCSERRSPYSRDGSQLK
jgi:hypothetical protein